MAKKRLIPKLLMQKGGYQNSQNVVVRTKSFSNPTQIGEVVSQSKIFQDQIADELTILKIDENIHFEELKDISNAIADEIFMPLTMGGGIDSIDKIRQLLSSGADKIALNTHAFENPTLIQEASHNFGSSTIVVSIDYKVSLSGEAKVYIQNGKKNTGVNLLDWATKAEALGAGELLVCCIDKDGSRTGLDIAYGVILQQLVNIPVVISGGCGLSQHFTEGFLKTNVSGISAGTFFALQDQNFIQTRSQILNSGIDIRH
jgi:imidazole glycerol-phosphate synthase subunit HisF